MCGNEEEASLGRAGRTDPLELAKKGRYPLARATLKRILWLRLRLVSLEAGENCFHWLVSQNGVKNSDSFESEDASHLLFVMET